MTEVANLALYAGVGGGEHGRRPNGQKEVMRAAPSLTGPSLVTSHMAPATVEAGMVDLSPLCSILFLAGVVVGVVLARGADPVQVCAVLPFCPCVESAETASEASDGSAWAGSLAKLAILLQSGAIGEQEIKFPKPARERR